MAKSESNKKGITLVGAVIGLPLLGCVFLPVLIVVVILAAAGNFLGWLFGGGAPSVSSGDLTEVAPGSPASTIQLWTPTPIPDSCFITPTPVPITVVLPPDTLPPTPVDQPQPTNTAGFITQFLPTPTPCPPVPNNWATPDPRWTPVPEGYGPRGSPYRAKYVFTQAYGCTDFPEFKDQVCAASTGGRLPWFHRGVDLVSLGEKTIYSTIEGQVIFAGWADDGFGYRVYLSQPPWLVIYPHLSRVLVAPGQNIPWGVAIGVEGSTGYSTGSHLHYEVHINGAWVDSTPFLTRD